jgi:hypothetical protein
VVVGVRGVVQALAVLAASRRAVVSLVGVGAVTYGAYLAWGPAAGWLAFGGLLVADAAATAVLERP